MSGITLMNLRRLSVICVALTGFCARVEAVLPTTAKPILFVTQIPMPEEVNSRDASVSYMSCVSPFGSHLSGTAFAGRGGGLWLRLPDGSLVNLTQSATWDTPFAKPAANEIAVRSPHVHWDGKRALFSMVVGAPANASDTTSYYWQVFEITALDQVTDPTKGALAHIALVPNQPGNYNNVSPCYDPSGRIIFASDRPYNGLAHLTQREEYLLLPSVSGLWSLDPQNANSLFLLYHSPSGAFAPSVDSSGRLVFVNWDHLSRDSEAVTDSRAGDPNYGETFAQTNNGTVNFASELAGASFAGPSIYPAPPLDIFPEPRSFDRKTLALQFGGTLNGNAFNIFLPWMINLDGTGAEVINHVGRHEIAGTLTRSFTNDPAIVDLNPGVNPNYGGLTIRNFINNFMSIHEDPAHVGKFFGVDSPDLGTHTAGQIVSLNGAAGINPDTMAITYVTSATGAAAGSTPVKPPFIPTVRPTIHLPAPSPAPTPRLVAEDLYRNPLPLSDGALIASVTAATQTDFDQNIDVTPQSLYSFRLKTLKLQNGSTFYIPDQNMTGGINVTNLQYWVGASQVTYTGPMWELDPVEVASRPVPTATANTVDPVEAGVFSEEGVNVPTFQTYLQNNNAALVISRNVTVRDRHDRQQPFNLKVAWPTSATQTIGTAGTIYPVGWLQILEADLRRGLTLGGLTPLPGRRVVATPLHTTTSQNIPALSGQPAGSFKLEDDGSFAAIIPARKALTWHLLNNDVNTTSQVKERFWVTFQPGEVRTCANCHGINTSDQAGNPKPTNKPQALRSLLRYWSKGGPAFSSPTFTTLKTSGTIALPVSRLGGSTGAITVNYSTQNGTALSGTDYTATSGTLNWADADASPQYVNIPIINNSTIASGKTFTVTLSGTNPAPVTPSTLAVTINQPPYEAWLLKRFGANANNPAVAGPDVDGNGDGFGNLAEYAFNRNPVGAPGPGQPFDISIVLDPNDGKRYLTMHYTRLLAPRDITYHLETSTGLMTWAEDSTVAQELFATPDVNGVTESVTVRSVKPIDQILGNQLFMRVNVTKP